MYGACAAEETSAWHSKTDLLSCDKSLRHLGNQIPGVTRSCAVQVPMACCNSSSHYILSNIFSV